MNFKLKNIIIYFFIFIFSHSAYAFDKDLNKFKKEIERYMDEYKNKIEKLRKSKLPEGDQIDKASEEFLNLLKYSSKKLNNDEIYVAIEAMDFLSKNIDAAIKIIPPESITTLEEVDFNKFSSHQSNLLNSIMTGMNRKKMDDFKEMVTKMVVLEKDGFKAESFMSNLQELDMGLAMLNDDTLDLDFELAGLSEKNLNDISKDLEQLDKDIQKLNMQKVTEEIKNVSKDLNKTASDVENQLSTSSSNIDKQINTNTISSAAKNVTSSISNDNISNVTADVSESLSSTKISEVTENISQNVADSAIVNATDVLENSDVIVDAAEVLQNSDVIVDAAEVLQNSDVIVDAADILQNNSVITNTAQTLSNFTSTTDVFDTLNTWGSTTDVFNSLNNFDYQSYIDSLPTLEESMSNMLTTTYKNVEKIGNQQTSIFSDMAQQSLQQWVNPNAECWTASNGYSVECNY